MVNDFNIEWQGSEEATAEEILYSIIGKPLKAGLPVTIAIIGHSRAGKSLFGLKIQDIVYQRQGLNFEEYVEDCVLIKPVDYSKKTKLILEGKEHFKKAQSIQMDEAKFLIDSSEWQTLKNKAIRTIAATSASIKPMLFIIIAQMLSDIDSKTRKSIDILFSVKRSPSGRPKIKAVTFYEKIDDLDKVRIKPRAIQGILNYHNRTKAIKLFPTFRPSLPRKEVLDKYWSFEQENKKEEIFALLEQIKNESDKLTGKNIIKLREFAQHLVNNPDELSKIGDFGKNNKKWKFNKDAKERYNYDNKEFKIIEQYVQEIFIKNKIKEFEQEKVVLNE